MTDLDSLLMAARVQVVAPSDALMARVMADAATLQPKGALQPKAAMRPVVREVHVASAARFLDRLAAMFGGGGALAGVSFAMVAGIFIGVVQPAPVAALTAALLAETQLGLVDLFPAETALWEEPHYD